MPPASCKLPDDDTARALYDTTQEICAAHGLPAYEISNHARPGGECRHNLVYWRAHEYAGIGPGAHGRLDIDGDRHATATEKRPGSLADAGREPRPRPRHRRRADPRRNVRRVPADGAAARRRHRHCALRRGCPAARSIRSASPRCASMAWSRRRPTAACASPCRAFRCWMRWSPIWRLRRFDIRKRA